MATHLLLRIARLLFGAVPQRRGRPARPTRLPLAAASDPFADASAASLATQRSAAARLRHTGQVMRASEAGDHLQATLAAGLAKAVVLHRCDGIPPQPEWRSPQGPGPESRPAMPLHAAHTALLSAGLERLITLEHAFAGLTGTPRPVLLVLCEDPALLPPVGAWLHRQGVAVGEGVSSQDRVLRGLDEAAWPALRPVDEATAPRTTDAGGHTLLATPGRPGPRVITALLDAGQDWGATQVCVIAVLRTGRTSAIAAHTIAPGQRLMWRHGSRHSRLDFQRLRQDNARLMRDGLAPATLVDVLTVIEHPRFHIAYNTLLHHGLAVLAGRELDDRTGAGKPPTQRGDLRPVHLRKGFEAFDFVIPAGGDAGPADAASGHASDDSIFGVANDPLYDLAPAAPVSAGPGRAVGGASRTGVTGFGEFDSAARQGTGPALIAPSHASHASQASHAMHAGDRRHGLAAPMPIAPTGGPAARRRHLSQVPQLLLSDSRALPVSKCIYTHQAWPAAQGMLERALILWAQADTGITAFCQLGEPLQALARIAYCRDDGRRGHYTPDFLVATPHIVYWIETRRPQGTLPKETRHRHRAALTWCERVNRLPAEQRSGKSWHYVALAEHLLLQAQARGQSLPELLERTRLRRGGPASSRPADGNDTSSRMEAA